ETWFSPRSLTSSDLLPSIYNVPAKAMLSTVLPCDSITLRVCLTNVDVAGTEDGAKVKGYGEAAVVSGDVIEDDGFAGVIMVEDLISSLANSQPAKGASPSSTYSPITKSNAL
ncbi:hypothetical protein Tco_1080744, partial [Tanacetum coccineum]